MRIQAEEWIEYIALLSRSNVNDDDSWYKFLSKAKIRQQKKKKRNNQQRQKCVVRKYVPAENSSAIFIFYYLSQSLYLLDFLHTFYFFSVSRANKSVHQRNSVHDK